MDENVSKKDIIYKNDSDVLPLITKKILFFKDLIQKTIMHVQKNKFLDILGISDVNSCIERLGELNKKLSIAPDLNDTNTTINNLQTINNEISGVLKIYGTDSLEDLLLVCFGSHNKLIADEKDKEKAEILKKYFHPISYKVISRKEDVKKKKSETESEDNVKNFSCYDISTSYKQFHVKVYGIKIIINSEALKKSLTVFGILDDVMVDFLNFKFITSKIDKVIENIPPDKDFKNQSFSKFVSSLTLKDLLINENEIEIYKIYAGHISQNNFIRQKQISQVVKEFISDDIYSKRLTLMNLLIHSSSYDNQYIAYLLYDLLSNESNGSIDTQEQTILFDSLPWPIKQCFKQAMKKTIQYTNELSNYDMNRIPLEQQICLLKAADSVKEKAMVKLKEVKAKAEDSGSKARQYLDGLLKIPFCIYKKEPILFIMDSIRSQFKDLYIKYNIEKMYSNIPKKEKYTNIEILKYIRQIKGGDKVSTQNNSNNIETIRKHMVTGNKKILSENLFFLEKLFKKHEKQIDNKLLHATLTSINLLTKHKILSEIEALIKILQQPDNSDLLKDLSDSYKNIISNNKYQKKSEQNNSNNINNINNCSVILSPSPIKNDLELINSNISKISDYMENVRSTLDDAVYGHEKAKTQLERIIGQWINGEQDGYCFGFEGPPGVGKTSLAKRGLSNCLKDSEGVSRPFSMIQMGGDSNGSSLHGHGYTYVGSTWGSIVQILIDKRCMNPIIFIDEVDKISRTEHGKEIVGILTHLLDPAQNDCFQDKYFTGIDLDLSKALFILSYNDPDSIDKILLDRVHRIKFSNLSLEDKLVISKSHLLPDIYKKMGLNGVIEFTDEVLKFIIEEYTLEAGVRKLKEILFEIVGQINIEILKNGDKDYEFPIIINICDVKTRYLKDKREHITRKVPDKSLVGFVNGLYATSLGTGGTLPIHAKFFPSDKFLDLKLTGMQQEVMRESMHVSLTVAWGLLDTKIHSKLRAEYDGTNKYGINIHTGDGSVHKDGPSGGMATTCAIYSLLTGIPVEAAFGITGEIQLSGEVTAIGGLSNKILGSVKAGVKSFIYPKENQKDFDEFFEKYKEKDIIDRVNFHPVSNVNEALILLKLIKSE
jgi:ATP-dependent Lon protease